MGWHGWRVVCWNTTDGSYTKYTNTDGLADNRLIYAIANDAVANVWVGTYKGVSKFDGITWSNYTTADRQANNRVLAIAFDIPSGIAFTQEFYLPVLRR